MTTDMIQGSRALLSALGIVMLATVSTADEPQVAIEGPIHAKGIALFRFELPADSGQLPSLQLYISRDGQTYVDAQAAVTRGQTRRGSQATGQAAKIVVVSPVFAPHARRLPDEFTFNAPGSLMLRWDVMPQEGGEPAFQIQQTVTVQPARPADLQFLSDLGQLSRFSALFPGAEASGTGKFRELVQEAALERRALFVLDQVVDGTFKLEPGDLKHPERADLIFEGAEAVQESSYAPYAAYHAALAYTLRLWAKPEYGGDRGVVPESASDSLYTKSDEALALAITHGDAFVKPRALILKARLRAGVGAWDEAEQILDQAVGESAGQDVIRMAVERVQVGWTHIQEKLQRRAAEQAGNPSSP